jgi:tetratricopeptide (TPR) repeat protein
MMRKCFVMLGGMLALLTMLSLPRLAEGRALSPQGQQQSGQQPTYTLAEYNAFQACRAETNAQTRVKCLDDFVAKFPNSTLMQYVYQLYIDTYKQQNNFVKTVEYADRLLALGDKIQPQGRLQALVARCTAFESSYNAKAPDVQEQIAKERDAAQQGLKLLNDLPKPANVSDEQFAEQKKPANSFFYNALGFANLQAKDFKAAADAFKNAVAANPKDAIAYYRLGIAYLQQNPPQSLDGFWAVAKAIGLKAPGEAQVRTYLRAQVQRYQVSGCDDLLDAQVNELLTLAQNSAERPATYSLASSADLDKIRQGSTILTVLNDLKAGGDKAKMTWLAVCGSEFQDVPGRIIEMTSDDKGTAFKLYTGASQEEMDAATDPNSLINITDQPEVKRFEKGDYFRYTGTLVSYDPQPLLVHWDKAKINREDIPPEKSEPGKRRKLPKKPGNQ